MRKTAEGKRFEAARQAWMEQISAEGKKIVSGEEADTLYEVETLLGLALRRLYRAHFVSAHDLQQRLSGLYLEMQAVRAQTVAYTSFRMETAETTKRLPDLVLMVDETTETEQADAAR